MKQSPRLCRSQAPLGNASREAPLREARAYDPRVLAALRIWGFREKVFSARALAKRSKTDWVCWWVLGGKRGVSYHTLSDFLRQEGEVLDDLLSQTITVLHSCGAVSFDTLLVDGTRTDARASADSFHDEAGLLAAVSQKLLSLRERGPGDTARERAARKRAERELRSRQDEAVEKLRSRQADLGAQGPKAMREKSGRVKTSLSDPDARMMRHADGGKRASVNIQVGSCIPAPATTPKKKTKTNPPRAIHSRGGTAPHDHSCGQHTPDTGATPKKKTKTNLPRAIHSRDGTAPHDHSCGQHTPDTGATPKKKTKTNPPRAIHSRGGTAPHDHSRGQHTPDTGATPKKKTKTNPPRAIHSRGGTAPHDHSRGQHTPDTGATPKKKTKTNPPRAIHSRGGTAPHDHSRGQHTPDTGATLKKKTKTNPPRAIHSRGGTAPHDHSRGQHTPDTGATSKEKNKNQPPSCHPLPWWHGAA